MLYVTFGCSARNAARMPERWQEPWYSPLPMEISPVSIASCFNSRFVISESVTISSARRRNNIPSSVNVTLWLLRLNSFTPSSCSSPISWRESVGCVICKSCAAFVMFSSRATARKYCKTRISIDMKAAS